MEGVSVNDSGPGGATIFTTHNEEWLEAIFENADTNDVALWRLAREDGVPKLRRFGGKQISIAIEGSGEVR